MKRKLSTSFYLDADVVGLAKKLIGKVLVSNLDNSLCSGIITETEAYNGVGDKASHAYGARRTARTEIMFREGGLAYIYLCYGIHSLFNVVTGVEGEPTAVLIRALYPLSGIKKMEERRNRKYTSEKFCEGPGTVSEAMGFHYRMSGISLLGETVWLEDHGYYFNTIDIQTSARIGVAYAGEDARLPYRFKLCKSTLYSKINPV